MELHAGKNAAIGRSVDLLEQVRATMLAMTNAGIPVTSGNESLAAALHCYLFESIHSEVNDDLIEDNPTVEEIVTVFR